MRLVPIRVKDRTSRRYREARGVAVLRTTLVEVNDPIAVHDAASRAGRIEEKTVDSVGRERRRSRWSRMKNAIGKWRP